MQYKFSLNYKSPRNNSPADRNNNVLSHNSLLYIRRYISASTWTNSRLLLFFSLGYEQYINPRIKPTKVIMLYKKC